jgi:hypothetical protein
MDLDLPVRVWRGRSYKPLVAFLVLDLDGRININVAGNRRGVGGSSASNQGWGAWETDLSRALEFNESIQLFANTNGRYGGDRTPNGRFQPDPACPSPSVAPCRVFNPFYAPVDFDGSLMTSAGSQPRMRLPEAPSTRASPLFPSRYAGGSTDERTEHPLLFNSYLANRDAAVSTSDRVFGVNEMLLLNRRFNGDDRVYQQADLGRLLPLNLGRSCAPGKEGWPTTAVNPRFLVTTLSNDVDGVGASAWRFDDSPYELTPPPAVDGVDQAAGPPRGAPTRFPALAKRWSARPSANSDFDPVTWKAKLAESSAVDLARPLADYRVDPLKPYEEPGNASAESTAKADDDRQRLARDLFERFCLATGANRATARPGTPEFHALRYLAQLAANIVDQVDSDDVSTGFVWNPIDPDRPRDAANFAPAVREDRVVFGVELPRLVINEACVRVENGAMLPGLDDTDPGLLPLGQLPRATFYNVKIWAELHNPLTPGTASAENLSHRGGAALTFAGHQVYRLQLTEPNRHLRNPGNVTGAPDAPIRATVDLPAGVYAPVDGVIPTSNAAYIQPRGPESAFYVIAPEPTPGDLVIPSAQAPGMKFRLKPEEFKDRDGARTTLLLRRLACPYRPPSDDNPYITVDVMEFERDMINDARLFDDRGLILPPPLSIVLQRGYGRKQPYAGHPSQVVAQNLIPAPVAGFNHTFFRHNGQGDLITKAGLTLTQPFDWLAHLDREPVSVGELLQVSAFKPHELTQQFIIESGGKALKQQQLAPWMADESRLFRALESIRPRDRTLGAATGGRTPGKININTIWDEKIFEAIAAANSANHFTTDEVRALWSKVQKSRTPADSPAQAIDQDRPFMPLTSPITPSDDPQFPGYGVERSLSRADPANANRRLLDTSEAHPFLKNELYSKIAGRLTTRSNTFAVWLTVGYFEVTDASAQPVKLGPEIGAADGTNLRHRFFAIIDRSNLSIDPKAPTRQGPRLIDLPFEPEEPPQSAAGVVVVIPASSYANGVLRGIMDDAAWELRNGDQVTVDPGPSAERVSVQIVDFRPDRGARIRLTCLKRHDRGCAIRLGDAIPGNPGPQRGFHVRDPRYAGIVRCFAILD